MNRGPFTKQLSKNLGLSAFVSEKLTLIPFYKLSKKSQNLSKKYIDKVNLIGVLSQNKVSFLKRKSCPVNRL